MTVNFSSDEPRQAELLAQAYRAARRDRLPADLDLDGDMLHLTVSGDPEELRCILEYLESQSCRGDVLVELFSNEERERLGQVELSGISVEIYTWRPEKSALPEVEVYD